MPVTVKVNINPQQIISNHHLEDGGAAQMLMANEVLRFSKPYTPFRQGILSDATIQNNGKQLLYSTPYARYQWYGKVMAGNPREVTDKDLTYQGAPMRGKQWTTRAMIDHITDVEKAIASLVGGRTK